MQHRLQTTCLLLLSAIAVGAALYWLRPVMLPFVLAVFIWLGLSSLVDFQMRRLRLPRAAALIVTLILAVAFFALIGLVISASVSQLAANASAYQAQLAQLLGRVTEALPVELPDLGPEASLWNFSEGTVGAVGGMFLATTNAILELLSQSLLVLVFVIFLMIGGEGRRQAPSGVWGEAEARVKRYLVAKAVISAATGTLVGLTLALLGVDLALVFGLFAFLLNFIPSIGSIIATLLPLPVVLVSPELSATAAVLAIAVPGAIQLVIGSFVDPRIMGEALDLHPVVILIALIFWGMLWGIAGALLAVPITAVIKIALEKSEQARPITELMAGRLEALRSP
jgi:AI-2 transport protein TqsA